MARFTIISTLYNEYELLRQFVESILLHVDPDTYDQVIIVDDYSYNKGILREYENYVNKTYDKFHIITHDEYRHAKWYQGGQVENRQVDSTFDYRLFDTLEPNKGIMMSYQEALSHTNTEFALVLDTDCVFLSKFKNTLDTIANLYDNHPQVMSISQLHGHSSDDIFTSNIVGMKNIPAESGGCGGPSPMSSTFKIESWTKHDLAPLCSRPGGRAGTGFIDFFLSVIGNGFEVMNFPLFSGDYIYHIGGGTARRNLGNLPRSIQVPYGSAQDVGKYGSRNAIEYTHDYYAGAHRIKMSSPQFLAYLQDKYTAPFDQMIPFDENMLIKLALAPNRDTVFKPAPFAVTDRLDHFKGPRNERNRGDYSIYDTYTYGDKEKT